MLKLLSCLLCLALVGCQDTVLSNPDLQSSSAQDVSLSNPNLAVTSSIDTTNETISSVPSPEGETVEQLQETVLTNPNIQDTTLSNPNTADTVLSNPNTADTVLSNPNLAPTPTPTPTPAPAPQDTVLTNPAAAPSNPNLAQPLQDTVLANPNLAPAPAPETQDTVLQNPSLAPAPAPETYDTVLSNPSLAPTPTPTPAPEDSLLSNPNLDTVVSNPSLTPAPQDTVLSNPNSVSSDTVLSNPSLAPQDATLLNPSLPPASVDTTLSNPSLAPNPVAAPQDSVLSNPSQDTTISNPSLSQDTTLSNNNNNNQDAILVNPNSNAAIASQAASVSTVNGQSCDQTVNGCVCKSQWMYSIGGGDAKVNTGCSNPDEDKQGLWCVIDQATCSTLNPNLFIMRNIQREIQNWFDNREYIDYCNKGCPQNSMGEVKCSRSINGCSCKPLWTYETPIGIGTFKGCQNIDNDIKGDWCKIDETTCPGILQFLGTTQDTGEYFDYCDCAAESATVAAAPLAPAGDCVTNKGCLCLTNWTFQNYTGYNCDNPDNWDQGPYCVVDVNGPDGQCQPQGSIGVGQQQSKFYDFCNCPTG